MMIIAIVTFLQFVCTVESNQAQRWVQLELGNGNAAPSDLPSEMGSFYWHSMRHLRHDYITRINEEK